MHSKFTIKMIANEATVSKSAINQRINKIEAHDSNFHKHITIGKRGTKLIDKFGTNRILSSTKSRLHVNGVKSKQLITYLMTENQRLTLELNHQQQLSAHSQKIAENAQNEAKKLRLRGTVKHKHTWLWKLFH